MSPYPPEPVRAVGPMRIVLTAYPRREDALEAARAAVERRLAACANVLAAESRFAWRGAIEATTESLVLFKTVPKRVGALFAFLESTHPYEVPEIAELDVPRIHPGYLRYLAETLDASALSPPAAARRRGGPRGRGVPGPRRTRARPHRPSRRTGSLR
ncbi:MAG TPA: divalent-cation tolerance protein CutA [Thermoplasmata archaeon]|nr:divalent-cation tolerance protein CutA [Thermoplasmata archaeon]